MGVLRLPSLGVDFLNADVPGVCEALVKETSESARPIRVHTVNIDHYLRALRNPRFREIVVSADFRTFDGVPLCWLARLETGVKPVRRVTGVDLVEELSLAAHRNGLRVGVVGSTSVAIAQAEDKIKGREPTFRFACSLAPNRSMLARHPERIATKAREADVDVLFVALGSPLQEEWVVEHAVTSGARLLTGVGGAVDIVGGVRRRAPTWLQVIGGEWVYRLAQEPSRLWSRYLIDDWEIVWVLLRTALRRDHARAG